ncbi:MAG: flagellar export protein FliJ [Gammaproteobacteria bacterium]
MARSRRLSPLLKLAEARERNAVQVVLRARQQLHDYEEKLAELRTYRQEYGRSFKAAQAHATTGKQLQEYQNFMHQLNRGITLLAEKIAGQKQLNLRDERLWVKAKKRSDALDKLVDKLRGMERNFRLTLEANEIDEHSQHRKAEL